MVECSALPAFTLCRVPNTADLHGQETFWRRGSGTCNAVQVGVVAL